MESTASTDTPKRGSRPKVFIGSSSEGKPFARAARGLLEPEAEVTLWDEDFAALGLTLIETLVRQAPSFDFAILILTPDDAVKSRETESFGPRDNVIFELGLFIGTLGRSRTFLLHQADSALKIPSDLAGVTTAAFAWPREDRNRKSALGASIDTIRDEIERQGASSKATRLELERVEDRLAQFETQLMQQILPFLVPQPMLKHLEALERSEDGQPKPADEYRGNEHLRGQLRTLRDIGLVEVASGRTGISSVPDGRFDLAAYVRLTPRGREWIQRARSSI